MFCPKCGAQLADQAAFCGSCGAKVEADQVSQASNESAQGSNETVQVTQTSVSTSVSKTKISDAGLGKVVVAAVAVVVLCILIACVANGKKKIDLNDYLVVEFTGYETKGKASYSIDEKKFADKFDGKLKLNKKKARKMLEKEGISPDSIFAIEAMKIDPVDAILSEFRGEFDQEQDLSNGDEVVFSWKISEDDLEEMETLFNCKIKGADKKFKVKDLDELKEFDPFEEVSVTFTGTAPEGEVLVDRKGKNGIYGDIYYETAEYYDNLSNGDEVIVEAKCYQGDLETFATENYGMVPSALEKTYTVADLPEYIGDAAEITEEVMQKMQKQCTDAIMSGTTLWNERAKLDNITYIGNYMCTKKPGAYGKNNIIYLVFKVTAEVTNTPDDKKTVQEKCTYYSVFSFKDIMKLPDGTITVDMSEYFDESQYSSTLFNFDFGTFFAPSTIRFYGCDTLDTVFNKFIVANMENYNYQDNVQDVEISE